MLTPDIHIFTDAASVSDIVAYSREPWVSGFTTNPTLMRKAGVTDYKLFAMQAIDAADGKPLSLEVVADDLATMKQQGSTLGAWAPNVVVKIPISNTKGESCLPVIKELVQEGIRVNVTAMMTDAQMESLLGVLNPADHVIASVFAGRIADAGYDPVPIMARYVQWTGGLPETKLLWASPREVLNIVQAADIGCDIITVTPDLLVKMKNLGKDLEVFSLETVQMFYDDAVEAKLSVS